MWLRLAQCFICALDLFNVRHMIGALLHSCRPSDWSQTKAKAMDKAKVTKRPPKIKAQIKNAPILPGPKRGELVW